MSELGKYAEPSKQISNRSNRLDALSLFVSRLMQEDDIIKISKETMKEIANQFGITEMIMAIYDEDGRRFKLLASHGYPSDLEKEISTFEYGNDWITKELQEKYRISEDIYFLNAEDWEPEEVDELLLDERDKIESPREYENQWHEKDFFEIVLRDNKNNIIGAIEINDSKSDTLPSFETILGIFIFARIAGVLLANANLRSRQKEIMGRLEDLSAIMSHDLGTALKETMRLLRNLQRAKYDELLQKQVFREIVKIMEKSLDIIDKIQKLRNIESRPYSLFVLMDILRYVHRNAEEFEDKVKGLNIKLKSEKRAIFIKCDPTIEALFAAAFDTIVSLKNDMKDEIIVEVTELSEKRALPEIHIMFASEDIDYASWQKLSNNLKSAASGLRKTPSSGEMFSNYLLTYISQKYGGKAWVAERSAAGGRNTGALKISLPVL